MVEHGQDIGRNFPVEAKRILEDGFRSGIPVNLSQLAKDFGLDLSMVKAANSEIQAKLEQQTAETVQQPKPSEPEVKKEEVAEEVGRHADSMKAIEQHKEQTKPKKAEDSALSYLLSKQDQTEPQQVKTKPSGVGTADSKLDEAQQKLTSSDARDVLKSTSQPIKVDLRKVAGFTYDKQITSGGLQRMEGKVKGDTPHPLAKQLGKEADKPIGVALTMKGVKGGETVTSYGVRPPTVGQATQVGQQQSASAGGRYRK